MYLKEHPQLAKSLEDKIREEFLTKKTAPVKFELEPVDD